MRMSAALFPFALAAIILVPRAQAQDAREGPIEIEKCQTISQPGSYKLVNNLTFPGSTGTCLPITADFVTIDLAGFSITGPGRIFPNQTQAIAAGDNTRGIAVRNGSISDFGSSVDLAGAGSLVEGLRVICGIGGAVGIGAEGIVKGNIVDSCGGPAEDRGGPVISATGIVTGNYVPSGFRGMLIGQGSTVTGNTVTNTLLPGIEVACPSNVTENTVVNININLRRNLIRLDGDGCTNTNNVAQ